MDKNIINNAAEFGADVAGEAAGAVNRNDEIVIFNKRSGNSGFFRVL